MTEIIEANIASTKHFRADLDEVLQRLKKDSAQGERYARSSRERSIAITKIQEAIMWLGMDLKAINEENPGTSPVIEPTADGLKL